MSRRVHTTRELHRIGKDYGKELAAALVLASSRDGADRALKRQMAQIVHKLIEGAVRDLTNIAFPIDLILIYERGVREGVREELLKSVQIASQLHRAA